MISTASAIRLPFNRPEYVAVPEAFVSAIAWKVFAAPELLEPASNKQVGLIFRGALPTAVRVEFKATSPDDHDGLTELGEALTRAGLEVEGSPILLAKAVLNSVQGIRVERSGIQPASPISPSLALIQNVRGLLRKENPSAIADILENMYFLGNTPSSDRRGVSARWRDSATCRLRIDGLIAALDRALDSAIVKRIEVEPVEIAESPLAGLFPNTPYSWFAESWNRLTRDDWVQALPARVWVDWATTVLRLAFGAGFLWESSWYLALAHEILSEDQVRALSTIQAEMGEVIPWTSSRAGTAARDIAPRLVRRVNRAELVRHAIDIAMKEADMHDMSFDEGIRSLRQDRTLAEGLREALRSNERLKSGGNLWEAIKYALMTRDSSAESPDYYGLLRSHGRFLSVEPGTEWIAVVASLACDTPGGETDVANVLSALAELGMKPELRDIISLLERAGMARGSADADSGVLVESAF